MEAIIWFVVIIVGWSILKSLFSSGSAGSAGSEREAMEALEVRFNDTRANEDGTGALIKEVQVKGLFPIQRTKNIGFITSVFDEADGELKPVLSIIDAFQEDGSIVYQHVVEVGKIEPGQGFVSWVRVGVVIPEIMESPVSGQRNLKAIVRMVDLDNRPDIVHGYHDEDDLGIFWQRPLNFSNFFEGKGYEEASEHRDEAVSLSLKIGMAVAMSDGALDDSEGEVLKQCIVKSISPFGEEKQNSLKKIYNDAMRDAYADASDGNLNLSHLTERLNEIGEKSSKYETMELCFEVMAADGVADTEELKLIRKVAESLDLDMDEIDKMRDQNIVGLDASVSGHASIETILGIEPDWSKEQVKKHLRSEFNKWNNRLNTLSEGEERKNAQLMIDRIAEARKQYA